MNESPRQEIIMGIPAYNEVKYVGSLVLQPHQYADEVLVVRDGSTDYTATNYLSLNS